MIDEIDKAIEQCTLGMNWSADVGQRVIDQVTSLRKPAERVEDRYEVPDASDPVKVDKFLVQCFCSDLRADVRALIPDHVWHLVNSRYNNRATLCRAWVWLVASVKPALERLCARPDALAEVLRSRLSAFSLPVAQTPMIPVFEVDVDESGEKTYRAVKWVDRGAAGNAVEVKSRSVPKRNSRSKSAAMKWFLSFWSKQHNSLPPELTERHKVEMGQWFKDLESNHGTTLWLLMAKWLKCPGVASGIKDWPGLKELGDESVRWFHLRLNAHWDKLIFEPGRLAHCALAALTWLKKEVVGPAEPAPEKAEKPAPAPAHEGGGKTTRPDDLVTMVVAVREYHTSRNTIRRHIRKGTLTDYRPENAPKNATCLLSRAELDGVFPKKN